MPENQKIINKVLQVENELVEYKEKLTDSFEKEIVGSEPKSKGKVREKSKGKILELIAENPQITIPKIAETIGLSIAGVEKNIRQLKQEGIISRTSTTKSGEWIVKRIDKKSS